LNSNSEQNSCLIFEYAKRLYGAHRAWTQLANSSNANAKLLIAVMDEAASVIDQLGGKIETGTDALGTRGPVITNLDGMVIPYEVGLLGAERLLDLYRG
jgi:hypothetical protein